MKKSDSATQALQTLNYLTLQEKRNIHEATFAHKALDGKMPRNITADYKKLQPQTTNRAAENGTLNIPLHRTSKFQNSVLYRTVKAWNSTSPEIRKEKTHIFKRKLQSATIQQKFTSLKP